MESSSWEDLNHWDSYRLLEYSKGMKKVPDRRNRRVQIRVAKILLERKWEFEEFDEQIDAILAGWNFDDIEDFLNQLSKNEWKLKHIKWRVDEFQNIKWIIITILNNFCKRIEEDLNTNPLMTWVWWGVLPNELLKLYDLASDLWICENPELETKIVQLVDRYNVPLEKRTNSL